MGKGGTRWNQWQYQDMLDNISLWGEFISSPHQDIESPKQIGVCMCVCVFVFASQGSLVSPPTIRAQHAIQVYMACAMVVVSTRQIGSGFVKGCAIHPAMRRFREVEYVWIFGVFKQMYVFE